MAPRVVTADEAAQLVASGDTLLIGGSGAGHSVPDTLIAAIAKRFLAEGEPRNLTTVHPVGLGDRANRGIGHLAHPGLLKRVVCGTLVELAAGRTHGRRQHHRGLYAAAGLPVAIDARNGGRPPRSDHACRPAHVRRSAPWRRQTERTGDRRSGRTHRPSAARNICFSSPSMSTSRWCAAPAPTRTATSRWSMRRYSAR